MKTSDIAFLAIPVLLAASPFLPEAGLCIATHSAVIPAKAGTQYSRPCDLGIQVDPIRIGFLDQLDFPHPVPLFHLLLALDGGWRFVKPSTVPDLCSKTRLASSLVTPT
jgi:hypothetical protein